MPQHITNKNIVSVDQTTRQIQNLDRLIAGKNIRLAAYRPGGGIGDVLMSFPALRLLKERYPGSSMTYITDFGYLNGALQKICEHNPVIDKVVSHKEYTQSDYDLIANFYCPCWQHEVPKADPIHRIDLFARHCGFTIPLSEESRKIDYSVTPDERLWAQRWFAARACQPEQCVMIQPCSSNARRSYPPRKLRNTITRLGAMFPNLRFLVVQHSSDFDKETQWDYFKCIRVKDHGISELAALIERIPLVLCQDSALLHMAGALDTNILGLFGPTDWRARMYPKMNVICPADRLACWPTWYDTQFPEHIFWDPLTEELLVEESAEIIKNIYGETATDIKMRSYTPAINYEVL